MREELLNRGNESIFLCELTAEGGLGKFLEVNDTVCERLGYTRDELLQMSPLEILAPEAVMRVQEALAKLAKQGRVLFEATYRRQDGVVVPAVLSAHLIEVDGRPQIAVIGNDLSERAQMREFQRVFLQSAKDGLGLMNREGRFVEVNEALCNLSGHTRDELLAMTLGDIVTAEEGEVAEYIRVCHEDRAMRFLGEHRDPEGRVSAVEVSANYVEVESGLLLARVRDITEYRNATKALEDTKEWYRNIIETVQDSIWEVNAEGVYTYVSPTVTDMLGYEPEELIGKTPFDMMPPEEAQRVGVIFGGIAAEQKPFRSLENLNVHQDGHLVLFETNGVPFFHPDGTLAGYRGVDRDATQRKQAEENRERLLGWQQSISELQQSLLAPAPLEDKLKQITDSVVQLFDADFCRIWRIMPGDLCEHGCMHAELTEGPHICADRARCLRLLASSGRYTHLDGAAHRRVPFGAYKIGRVASGEDHKFLIADVQSDPIVHNHEWARELGLTSFAGYQLHVPGGETLGVLALFSQHQISPDEDALLDSLANTAAFVIQQAMAEESLQEATERYRNLVETVNDFIWEMDANGVYTYASPRVTAIRGYAPEELLGRRPSDFMPPDEAARLEGIFAEVAAAHGPFVSLENISIHKDGHTVVVETTGVPFFAPDGSLAGYRGVDRDITERKQAEEALHDAKQRYQDLVETVKDFIWETDITPVYTYASPGVKGVQGHSPEEVLGKAPFDFMAPDEAARMQAALADSIAAQVAFLNVQSIHIHKDGHPVVVETTGVPFFAPDGAMAGYRGIDRDVTERKRIEEALTAERERLAVTLHSIGDGVITTDIEGKIVLINRVAERLIGWSQAEAAGQPLEAVFHIVDERTRRPQPDPVKQVIELGGSVDLAAGTILLARDGTERYIADSGAPIRDPESKVIGVVIVFRDVTEQRKLQEEVLRAQKLDSIGVLAGGIAHDFNNTLTMIVGGISLAKSFAKPDDEVFTRLAEAEQAAYRAKDLTQQLLTFSRGGAPIKQTASITELVHDTASFSLSGSNVRCQFALPDDLWPVEVDSGQISQVIGNLVLNADEAMADGGTITIAAENVVTEADSHLPLECGRYVRISVKDEGIGIKPEHLSKVFDPYFTSKQRGSGLGLATSYSIIRQHGGHIGVVSQVGSGSEFFLYLPASDQELPARQPKLAEAARGEGRVLLMDDEPMILQVTGQLLQRLGYETECVADGGALLEEYATGMKAGRPFGAVIMDLTIPGGMGGKETIGKLLELDPQAKAIVSSGYSNDPIMAQFREHGFSGVVSKPYSVAELSEALRQVMGQSD